MPKMPLRLRGTDNVERIISLLMAGLTVLAVARKLMRGGKPTVSEVAAGVGASWALWTAFGARG